MIGPSQFQGKPIQIVAANVPGMSSNHETERFVPKPISISPSNLPMPASGAFKRQAFTNSPRSINAHDPGHTLDGVMNVLDESQSKQEYYRRNKMDNSDIQGAKKLYNQPAGMLKGAKVVG